MPTPTGVRSARDAASFLDVAKEFARHFPEWLLKRGEGLRIGPPRFQELWVDESKTLTVSRSCERDGLLKIDFCEEISVEIDFSRKWITEYSTDGSFSTREHFLLDQVLPRLISHYEAIVLHASAVSISGKAVLFIGSSGSGKSTLAASFAYANFEVTGDDAQIILRADNSVSVESTYPSLRLLPDSRARFYPGHPSHQVADYSTKRRVDVLGEPYRMPIDSLFFLSADMRDSGIVVRPLPKAEGCVALVQNSFALDATDTTQAKKRLEAAAALVNAVPTYSISYPRSFDELSAVRECIIRHATGVENAAAA